MFFYMFINMINAQCAFLKETEIQSFNSKSLKNIVT